MLSQRSDDAASHAALPPEQGAHASWSYERDTTGTLERIGWAVAMGICVAYVAYLVQLTSFPLLDYPNHIARGAVIADLLFHGGARFGEQFDLQLVPVPYVLHDLILATCIELFGTVGGAGVFTALALLSLPCALLFYMWANGVAPRARLAVFLISLYLTTDWYFLMGFMGFRFAIALILVALALADLLRRRWSAPLFATYVAVLVAGYLIHLTFLMFFAVVIGISAAVRLFFGVTTIRREAYLLFPVAALLALHVGFVPEAHGPANPPSSHYDWGTLHQKRSRLWHEFRRFGGTSAKLLLLALVVCVLWPLRQDLLRWRRILTPGVLEHLLIAAAFCGIYIVLPKEYADAAYVDVRALPMIALFGILAALHLADFRSGGAAFGTLPVRALAGLLALANLAYLAAHLTRNDEWITRYREVAAVAPRGANVLPVYTLLKQGDFSSFLHVGSFLVLDSGSVTPYLFSWDRGDSMMYFKYRHRPYMPHESWYRAHNIWEAAVEKTYEVLGKPYTWRFIYSPADFRWHGVELMPVDWNSVACDYRFLLVSKPFEARFIRVPVRKVVENEAAILLAVDRHACREGPRENVPRIVSLEH